MRPAWMTVHEGGRRDGTTTLATRNTDVARLCAVRDDAMQTIDTAREAVNRINHPDLIDLRDMLVRQLDDARTILSRPAALLLADQDLLRTSWIELQQALVQIQTMQAGVGHPDAAQALPE